MERKGRIYEMIIKATYFLLAFIAGVFIMKNIISVFPFFKSISYNEQQFYSTISNTQFGKIYNDIGIVEVIDKNVIANTIIAFFVNVEWIVLVFLIVSVALLFIYFMFIKWELIENYLIMTAYLFICYLLKYVLFALPILMFYKGTDSSLSISFIIGSSLYIIISLLEFVILSKLMIKFIFSFINDIKYIYTH